MAEPWHAQDNPGMLLGQIWDSPGALLGCGLGGYKGVSAAVAQLGEKEEKRGKLMVQVPEPRVSAAMALALHPQPLWGVFGDSPLCTPRGHTRGCHWAR